MHSFVVWTGRFGAVLQHDDVLNLLEAFRNFVFEDHDEKVGEMRMKLQGRVAAHDLISSSLLRKSDLSL
jgi:hypothetical protein